MKNTRNLLIAITLASVAASQAGTPKVYTFNESEEVKEYVTPTGKSTLLKIENEGDGGTLTFQAESGGDLVSFTPDGDLQTSGDGLELEFRTEGALTFGILTRRSNLEDPAYWVHCSLFVDSCSIVISRSTVSGQQTPDNKQLAYVTSKTYSQGEWYRLRLGVKSQGQSETLLSAEITEAAGGDVVIMAEGTDEVSSLAASGQIFLRFNAVSTAGGGKIEIRKVTIQD